MNIRVIDAPSSAITLAEAKAHLRVESSDDDTLIETYMAAAQGGIDGPAGWLGVSVGVQTLELTGPALDPDFAPGFPLPFGPVLSVMSVTYGSAALSLDGSAYSLSPDAVLRPKAGASWPWAAADLATVTIRYRAGFETVPAPIRAALLLMTADLYGTRDAKIAATLVENPTINRLLGPYRVWKL